MLRGSALGFFVGLLPGPCTVISTFVSYSLEKRISKTPEEFGHGAVEGVVGPGSANNSAVMGSMIPLLTLGLPFAAPSAIMLAGLRMHNVEPAMLTGKKVALAIKEDDALQPVDARKERSECSYP